MNDTELLNLIIEKEIDICDIKRNLNVDDYNHSCCRKPLSSKEFKILKRRIRANKKEGD